MPRVTAIVPTCNRPVMLERALRSIAAQELSPTEVIVVSDAGGHYENATRRVVEKCGLENSFVFNNWRTNGASGARNTGADLAIGEFLAFLDDDDEWLPSYLAEAMSSIALNDLDMICAGLYCQFDDGIDRPSKTGPEKLLPELFLTRNPGLVGSNFIIRRSLFHDIGDFDESLPACNDIDLGIRLSLHGNIKYERIPKRLVRIYQHGGEKLGTRGGEAMRVGLRRFYELHAHRMSETQRKEFCNNVRRFWGIDERGRVLDLPPTTFFEPLLPVLKARLDQRRGRQNR